MWIRILPPGRGSASQTGASKPCGPHQAARCFASVHMLNTSARGASNTRVIVTSRSAIGRLVAFIDIAPSISAPHALTAQRREVFSEDVEGFAPATAVAVARLVGVEA